MKRVWLGVIAAVMLLVSGPVRANEGSDWRFEVGSKMWVMDWDTKQNAGASVFLRNNVTNRNQYSNHTSANNKVGIAGIPYAYVGWKKLFITGSYSASGKFVFPETREVIANVIGAAAANRAFEISSKVTATRNEGDVNLGYMLFDQVGVTAGWKGVRLHYNEYVTGTQVGGGATLLPFENRNTYKYDGFVLGIAAGADLGKGFQIYGNGGGGWMKATLVDRTNGRDDKYSYGSAGYELAELGFKYQHKWLKALLGYRYQGIQSSIQGKDLTTDGVLPKLRNKDITSGYIMGLSAAF